MCRECAGHVKGMCMALAVAQSPEQISQELHVLKHVGASRPKV